MTRTQLFIVLNILDLLQPRPADILKHNREKFHGQRP